MAYNPDRRESRRDLQAKIIMTLANAGFVEDEISGGKFRLRGGPQDHKLSPKERVFSRSVNGTNSKVLVYTSIVDGHTRGCGKDAIRVCAIRPMTGGLSRGIVKTTRVNRVGKIDAICNRMLTRMREAYSRARAACKTANQCQCGADQFLSRRGNWVCSSFCWR